MKRRKTPKTQAHLDQFRGDDPAVFFSSLTPTKLNIIELLDDGYYGAAIARHLKISRSYVSRVITELKSRNLLEPEWVNPLLRRATSYRVVPELKTYIERFQKPKQPFTLFVPHRIRYKFPILNKTKTISVSTGRFAAAKVKHVKTWCMRGGNRYVFDMRHDHLGHIGIIVHPHSIEVYQRDRHQIPAVSPEDATAKMAIAINDVAMRFVQEQSWESVNFTLGQPELVGSPHYALKSRMGRGLTDAGQTNLQFGMGFEVDKSLEAKYQDPDYAEIENQDVDVAGIIDRGLKNAANIHEIVPALVRDELRSVSEQITGMTAQAEKIDTLCNNVQALCQSGLPIQNQLNQLMSVVAGQSSQITNMQKIILQVVDNMGKIIERFGEN